MHLVRIWLLDELLASLLQKVKIKIKKTRYAVKKTRKEKTAVSSLTSESGIFDWKK